MTVLKFQAKPPLLPVLLPQRLLNNLVVVVLQPVNGLVGPHLSSSRHNKQRSLQAT